MTSGATSSCSRPTARRGPAGRGTEYAPWGDVTATEIFTNDTATVRESYGYDLFGNRTSVTNALGDVVVKDYDVFGNVVAERGAAYPTETDYDTENCRIALRTTRNGTDWDETRWAYDAATGLCTAKTYADGSTVAYTYAPDGLPLRTIYASGAWTENLYNAKRQVVGTASSDGANDSLSVLDSFGRTTFVSNATASTAYALSDVGNATNEVASVGGISRALTRAFDGASRLSRLAIPAAGYELNYAYAADGRLATISNALAVITYAYAPDRRDAGYTITLANGTTFTRQVLRDPFRRELVTAITNIVNGATADSLAYAYDALARPISRNDDAFVYNARREVTGAVVSGIAAAYGYDDIGNSTNWAANCLNQYVSFPYDQNGNMISDGMFSYVYDSANRLISISSNGTILVTNEYDSKLRRVRKITPAAMHTFFYNGWNLVEEHIASTNGTTSIIHYHWGKDLSGELQGAGGIGGLLYLAIDGELYIPCYDGNGNITRYLDSSGNTVAQYTYDAFGDAIFQSGFLAQTFRHRFSTKYFDSESGLYYYGSRFYSPILNRWVARDPIEEDGGLNIYSFCLNNPLQFIDPRGNDIYLYTGNNSGNPINDAIHQTVAVDTWSDDCPPKKTGVRGFSFGYDGEWGWNWPNGKWLGHSSITLPGYWMVGEIYEAPVVGKIVNTKKTTPEQDKAWLQTMEGRVGTKVVYSVGRHNCRAFSQAEFDKAP